MAYIHVKTDDSLHNIESAMSAAEMQQDIGFQLDRTSDFIFIENHVFSKMAIEHIKVVPHEDEQGETKQTQQGGNDNAKKEPDYMG
ncbi:hypothetical protein K6L05_00190 [Salinicoccus roseus]|uniref:hypothetical protein n=1 Tax=Salinicoccus roseus TaxID=45670 RepID=UPI001CA6E9E1|nr:hypothetical protein [Salinicoccus roseus]MBY8908202.1 hypothetical protein [Salinicoccus roseus]